MGSLTPRLRTALLVTLAALSVSVSGSTSAHASARADEDMRRVGPGIYRPFYPSSPNEKDKAIAMHAFMLDRLPVTHAQFMEFVTGARTWRRSEVNRLFADEGYLRDWASDTERAPLVDPLAPIVNVSWFAAKAYCASRGARLPTEAEWEFAATAGEKSADGRDEPEWRARIVDWYAKPASFSSSPARTRVGGTPPNFWGVQDLHGVIWEWVLDFNSALVTSDARESGDKDTLRFCGAGALGADDKTDYPSFMRIAMRSSLRGDYTTKSLGFRCARAVPPPPSTPGRAGASTPKERGSR